MNEKWSSLPIIQQEARHDVIEKYLLNEEKVDQGPHGHARWIAVEKEICKNEGRTPHNEIEFCKSRISSRRWYLNNYTVHRNSSWATPRSRPSETYDELRASIQAELNGEHLLKRVLSHDMWEIQHSHVKTVLDDEPDKFAVLKQRRQESCSNALYWKERETLDAEGKGCDCTQCSQYPRGHPRRDPSLATVQHCGTEGRQLKRKYGMLAPYAIRDPVVMAAQHHVFKLLCSGGHNEEDLYKISLIVAGEMDNLNTDGTCSLYSPGRLTRYKIIAETSIKRNEENPTASPFQISTYMRVHNHHPAALLPVLVKCGNGRRDLVIDMGKRITVARLTWIGLVDFVSKFPREESVTVPTDGIVHDVWHLLDNNRDICDELGLELPEKTETHWTLPLDKLPRLKELLDGLPDDADVTELYEGVQNAEYGENGELLNAPTPYDESDSDVVDEDEFVLEMPSSSVVPTRKPKSKAAILAEVQDWKIKFEIRRHKPIAPPHLTAELPNPFSHLTRPSLPVATSEDLRQTTKRLREELAELDSKRRALADISNRRDIVSSMFVKSRSTSNPLLTLPPPPVISSRVVLTESGDRVFSISTSSMSIL